RVRTAGVVALPVVEAGVAALRELDVGDGRVPDRRAVGDLAGEGGRAAGVVVDGDGLGAGLRGLLLEGVLDDGVEERLGLLARFADVSGAGSAALGAAAAVVRRRSRGGHRAQTKGQSEAE